MMALDYESLRLLALAGLLFCVAGLTAAEFFAAGVAALAPALGADSVLWRRLLGPAVWQLGFLAAGLVLAAAAWPVAFAVFGGSLPWFLLFYVVVLGIRVFLLLAWPRWPQALTAAALKLLQYSGFSSLAVLGLIGGNLLKGAPFHLDSDMRNIFLGDGLGLLSPFALLAAACAVAAGLLQGVGFAAEALPAERVRAWGWRAGGAFGLLFIACGLWIMHLEGYHISSELMTGGPSNPLNKFVKRGEGLWLDNYEHYWALAAVPFLSASGAAASVFCLFKEKYLLARMGGAAAALFAVLTAAVSIFPFLLPSNRSLNSSLTIWDASASLLSLQWLAWFVVALPLLAVLGWGLGRLSGEETSQI